MIEPIAAVVAGPEPDIAAKNAQAMIVTIASPPVTWPISEEATPINRLDRPPVSISCPARIKKGTARNGNESEAIIAPCTSSIVGVPRYISARTVATPREIAIGTPIRNNTLKPPSKMAATIPASDTSSTSPEPTNHLLHQTQEHQCGADRQTGINIFEGNFHRGRNLRFDKFQ